MCVTHPNAQRCAVSSAATHVEVPRYANPTPRYQCTLSPVNKGIDGNAMCLCSTEPRQKSANALNAFEKRRSIALNPIHAHFKIEPPMKIAHPEDGFCWCLKP